MRGRPSLESSIFSRYLASFRAWSDNVPHDRLLFPVSDAADARGRCALQPGQFKCQHGLLLFDCGLLSGFTAGRERPIHMSHFSDSLAAISGFAVSLGAIVGPVSLVDATSSPGGQLLWVTSFSVPVSWDGLSARSTS